MKIRSRQTEGQRTTGTILGASISKCIPHVLSRVVQRQHISLLSPAKSIKSVFHAFPFIGKQKHRTSLMQTSVLSMQNIRTFAQRSPMFCNSRTVVSLLSEKKVFEKNYISYTHTPNIKCLLVFSGVGLGVGLDFRV